MTLVICIYIYVRVCVCVCVCVCFAGGCEIDVFLCVLQGVVRLTCFYVCYRGLLD